MKYIGYQGQRFCVKPQCYLSAEEAEGKCDGDPEARLLGQGEQMLGHAGECRREAAQDKDSTS